MPIYIVKEPNKKIYLSPRKYLSLYQSNKYTLEDKENANATSLPNNVIAINLPFQAMGLKNNQIKEMAKFAVKRRSLLRTK